jgi:nucleoside-diphosphate-sugar epimerase
MKTVLVTGATGGLGRNAVEYLLKRGVAVRATGRNNKVGAELQKAGAVYQRADLSVSLPEDLEHLMWDVDAVWHCAALSSPWGRREDFLAANVLATESLLKAAQRAGVPRFVHISTPALYFNYENRLGINENFRPQRYVNDYALTKAMAEDRVTQSARENPLMKHVILRPRAIFGPYDQVLLPRVAKLLEQHGGRLPLPREGRTVLDLTYVENVVHAMWLASTVEKVSSGSAFNVTNGQPQEIWEPLNELFHGELKRPFGIRNVPYPLLDGAARVLETIASFTGKEPSLTRYSIGALAFDMTLDLTNINQTLGYTPVVSMREGIRRTAAWMKKHG